MPRGSARLGNRRADRSARAARASKRSTVSPDSTRSVMSGSRRTRARTRSRWLPTRTKHIRWSKVMTAQARIATGYYDRKDVKEMVLQAVLKELSRH